MIRGQRVMLDRDLAAMYGVTTSNLNKAVKRNLGRFPADFMFQLTMDEAEASRSNWNLEEGHDIKILTPCFYPGGVTMLSGVLRSPRAEQVNIAILRAFVRLRESLSLHKELAHKLGELERKIENHDENIRTLFEAIHSLMTPPETPHREIGFTSRKAPYPIA